ncbi:prepilin-type N-terminal cleavage/methylation domain-containing protein [Citrobacter sp. Cb025]|nr:prepilin-type N-terminal cleavage/methylation domain-containing protein [Citrobacter sp. Cb025]MDM3419881.1 prepilin-type N-terminal cleavage/methylation domain-containing protein [Citrobacter sp. Cb025]
MSPRPEKQRGFTLLEVLLAIALFAMLSLLTAQMLTTTIDSNEQTKKHQQRFSAIVRTVNLLDKDIRQRVPVTELQGEKETLMLTTARSNSYPGACCAPDIQRVQWYLQDHTL